MAIRPKEKYIKVPESVIQEFRDKGMSASLKKYQEGRGDAAFNEGIKRFYPDAAKNLKPVTMQKDIPRSRTRRAEKQVAKGQKRDNHGRFVSNVARNATSAGTEVKAAAKKMGPFEKAQTKVDKTEGISTAALARRIERTKPTPKSKQASPAEVKSWGTIGPKPKTAVKRVPPGTRPKRDNPELPTGLELAGRWLKKKWTPKKAPAKGVKGSRRMM
jgi:hypothetical protein